MSDSGCDAVRGFWHGAGVLVTRCLEDGAGGRGAREGLEDLEHLEFKDLGWTRRRGGSCGRR
ncbi:hypothetical protein AQJ43_03305 [Streptomyces avermitilis]|uniref:Uncharacterized protein n=1 Tax=Streptomyces avermitilis TaxID=33903 RepID=A0A4D4MXI3_STRAX|nr:MULTISPECIES: hypothetical protein [Streptomyces]KUN56630.1 hypothetical protein AQJ43_03305 [Streptomyces avermitilis]MYS99050.1 hypothetical protein [Streptomyces sp. SID5469]OOV32646.1 hypothetical protein SM007_07470 [Streptomyces avermitilis]BBJ51345.1 hypothetical protein SAVMC3_39740 [Streptomyces avermitilis]GDY76474.1 hypothetical protein SAV31267_059590 [Streptomyces avermitilis]